MRRTERLATVPRTALLVHVSMGQNTVRSNFCQS